MISFLNNFFNSLLVYATPNIEFNENYELLAKKNGPNILFVDIIGILLFLLPIGWYPLASLTGESADRNDIETANYYYSAHYIALVVWEIIYSTVLIYFWYKLMSVIKSYIKVIEDRHIHSGITNSSQVESIRKSARNVIIILYYSLSLLLYFISNIGLIFYLHR
jgi:hypothetical protein